jgi:hypothetical protein
VRAFARSHGLDADLLVTLIYLRRWLTCDALARSACPHANKASQALHGGRMQVELKSVHKVNIRTLCHCGHIRPACGALDIPLKYEKGSSLSSRPRRYFNDRRNIS